MKKVLLLCFISCLIVASTNAQLMVSKLVGKDSEKYGLGYGLYTYYDFFLNNENQSIRLELFEFALFPEKGENFFSSNELARGYISIKLGYKYVFSDSKEGFYLLPSAGYCRIMHLDDGPEGTYGDGIAAALETGYTLGVGQGNNTLNFGLKYEYNRANATYVLQSVGLRVSFGFGLFRNRYN